MGVALRVENTPSQPRDTSRVEKEVPNTLEVVMLRTRRVGTLLQDDITDGKT